MRGVAALAVLILHLGVGVLNFRGYLAVDIFFALSGFVIAHAYEAKLLGGMSVPRFAVVRAIRLYPLVFAAVLAAVVLALLLAAAGRSDSTFPVAAIVLGMLLLPYLSADIDMFPVVSPTWSLFNEITINLVYAIAAPKLSNRILIAIVAVTGLILVPATILNGSVQFGPYKGTLLLGLVRTLFSFSVGVLIYRLKSSRSVSGHGWLALAVIGTGLLMAAPQGGRLGGLYDALVVAVGIPALIASTAHVKVVGHTGKVAALLGDLSYPVYLLHWPIRTALFASGIQTKVAAPLFLIGSAMLVCGVSYAALKLYDEPCRAALLRLIKSRKPATHPATAP